MSPSVQQWNAEAYAANGRFVADLSSEIVALLAPLPGERILDAGCGDGALTARLAASGAGVTGVDLSPAMVAAARLRAASGPHSFAVEQASLLELPFSEAFDAVFSNAALHWISAAEQPTLLAALLRVLIPGGRLVAELGGQGNIASIRAVLSALLADYGLDSEALASSCFPSATRYVQMLQEAGFVVHSVTLHPRPTALPGGPHGLTRWLETFRNGVLDHLPPHSRQEVLSRADELLRPILYDPATDSWTADYVRLRVLATRPK